MLAACYLFQQGTPFIYQGQELGMTNIALPSIDHYLDVASVNAYHSFFRWEPVEKRLRRIHRSSRDSARTPVQWSGEENAGFSTAEPWFYVNPNYREINAAAEDRDPNSILNFYRKCLKLRKDCPTLLWGSYREYRRHSGWLYLYERQWQGERILVACSFSKRQRRFSLPEGYAAEQAELLLDNYPAEQPGQVGTLRPYEVQVLRWK